MQVPRILKYRNSDPDINSFNFGIEISFLIERVLPAATKMKSQVV